ncbi:hypothetical protein ADM99_15140 [Leptolinea tardivitalis]|uniref:ABC transporter substrate-binding protein n=1 Tax=Leptolinea tardivitalis TaxID=229920 RepID=A0A0P6WNT3_9CHLR|nr:hypothetical protein ADM99_15140 [Leptolinea tardivitalis]
MSFLLRYMKLSVIKSIAPLCAFVLIFSACSVSQPVPSQTQTNETVTSSGTTQTVESVKETVTPAPSATIPAELASLKDTHIKIIHPWTDGAGVQFSRLIDSFNRENIWKIQIEESHSGSVSETARIFTDSMETSDRLDMVVTTPEYLAVWNDTGYTIDLTDFMENPEWGMPEKEKKAFLPAVWNTQIRKDRLIGIPVQVNLQFLVYNQTWAKELGFDKAPETQDDLLKQLCEAAHANNFDTVKENDGTGGWIINSSSPVLLSWINAFGGSKAWADDQVTINQDETGEAFSYLRQLTEKGCAWNSRVASPFTYFAGRQALVISATLPDLLELEETMSFAKNKDEWIILPYPGSEKPAPVLMSGLSIGVAKTRPVNELAAWLFLRWLTQPRNQAILAEAAGSIPPSTSTIDLMKTFSEKHVWWKTATELTPSGVMLPALPAWQKVRPVLEDGFWQMLQPTPIPVPTLMEQIDQTIKSVP